MIYSQSSTRKFTHSINTPPKSNQSFKLEHEPITPDSDCHGTPNFLSHAPITPNSESLSHKNITPDSETLHGLPKSNESSSAGVKRVMNISEPAPASTKSNKRPKGSAVARRERYLHQDYVSSLLLSNRLQAYDNGAKPICHSKCTHNCQKHFIQSEGGAVFLRGEMVKWWGEGVTSAHRNSLLAHEILLNAKRIDGKEPKASWFVGEKEVCRNFYLRARGVHHELARTTEKALLSQKTSVQGLVKERRLPKEKENTRGHIIKDWLQSYSKRFAEKSSTDKITVLPFQNIKLIYV